MQIVIVAMGYCLSTRAMRVICHLIHLSRFPSRSLSFFLWLHLFMNILSVCDFFNPDALLSTAQASTHQHAYSVQRDFSHSFPCVQFISMCTYKQTHNCFEGCHEGSSLFLCLSVWMRMSAFMTVRWLASQNKKACPIMSNEAMRYHIKLYTNLFLFLCLSPALFTVQSWIPPLI